MKQIAYREGYRYQLAEDYGMPIDIKPPAPISNRFVRLSADGWLSIRNDYAWDGPSGPAIDTPNFMRGSLVHDALYQLMREGLLDRAHRARADEILQEICIEDGMSLARAWWVHLGVRLGGGPAADPINDNPILTAP